MLIWEDPDRTGISTKRKSSTRLKLYSVFTRCSIMPRDFPSLEQLHRQGRTCTTGMHGTRKHLTAPTTGREGLAGLKYKAAILVTSSAFAKRILKQLTFSKDKPATRHGLARPASLQVETRRPSHLPGHCPSLEHLVTPPRNAED